LFVRAEQTVVCSFYDLRDVRLNAAAPIPLDTNHDPVTMHYPAHFSPAQIKVVGVFIVEDDKPKTVGVGVNSSGR
jgi:hypothetical protein